MSSLAVGTPANPREVRQRQTVRILTQLGRLFTEEAAAGYQREKSARVTPNKRRRGDPPPAWRGVNITFDRN